MTAVRVQSVAGGVRIAVRVQPRASDSRIVGAHGDALKVRLSAPPVDGAANDALRELLSDTFGIPIRAVTIVSGTGSRTKTVELLGVTEARVRQLVNP